MDKELKIRKLASASVRRQRSQEREIQRQQEYEEREERKRRMMRMSNIYDTDSDCSRPNSPENDSSADTPSEHGVRTPENSFSPKLEIKGQSIDSTVSQDFLKEDEPTKSEEVTTMSKPTILERQSVISRPTILEREPSRPTILEREPSKSSIPIVEREPLRPASPEKEPSKPAILKRDSSRPNVLARESSRSSIPEREPSKLTILEREPSRPTILERRRSKLDPPKATMFTSSLSRPCDFRYDRFSTIVDPVDLKLKPEEKSGSEDEESEEDSEDDYSPIELATPVAIRMPISRPSVVSVVGATTPGPQKFHVSNINTIMINPPKQPTQPRIIETLPTPSSEVASEPVFPVQKSETLTPSNASIVSVEPSSTKSLPGTSIASTDTGLKKKSSMPMLTRFTHARMHSLKNFIKPQSISGPPPAVPMIPTNHQTRPSESMTNILLSVNTHHSKPSVADKTLPPSPRRSLTEPNIPKAPTELQRPQTARAPSQSTINTFQSDVSALPPPLPDMSANWASKSSQEDEISMSRKKSFQSFRRRSGSIGQALKFGSSSKSKVVQDEPLPPMPTVRPPIPEPVQPINLPTPPMRTPRQVRKSGMNYSPFPPPMQRGEPVGLGLRM